MNVKSKKPKEEQKEEQIKKQRRKRTTFNKCILNDTHTYDTQKCYFNMTVYRIN